VLAVRDDRVAVERIGLDEDGVLALAVVVAVRGRGRRAGEQQRGGDRRAARYEESKSRRHGALPS
jgi:hypothetical protein